MSEDKKKTMEDDETYLVILICTNCGHGSLENIVKIPKGISVKDYAKKEVCSNCGCIGYFRKYMGAAGL